MSESLCCKCGGIIFNNNKHISTWRHKNPEKYREICRKAQAEYRENHREKIKQYKKEYYLRM